MKIINDGLFQKLFEQYPHTWQDTGYFIICCEYSPLKVYKTVVSPCHWPSFKVTRASQTWLLFNLQYLGQASFRCRPWLCKRLYRLTILFFLPCYVMNFELPAATHITSGKDIQIDNPQPGSKQITSFRNHSERWKRSYRSPLFPHPHPTSQFSLQMVKFL